MPPAHPPARPHQPSPRPVAEAAARGEGEPVLRLSGLVVGYGGRSLLPPLHVAMGAGEMWALVGRNGSGKSTLLKTLIGALPPVKGRLQWRRGLAVSHVPQRGDYEEAVPARAIDMVRAGVDRRWSFLDPFYVTRQQARVDAALREVGAEAFALWPFRTLSEGQKQRVWLARALASGPAVVLLDEPTSALDLGAERAAFDLLTHLRLHHGLTFIIATHHLAFLPEHATHGIFVDRDEQVAEAGPIERVMGAARYLSELALAGGGSG